MVGRFIPANPENYSVGRNGKTIKYIIIHTMDGFYEGSIAWFKNPAAKASAHFLISKLGEVTQMVEEKDMAWQATNLLMNQESIGIEHADERQPNSFVRPDALYEASAELVADICKRYNIPIDRKHILRHNEVFAGKSCPGTLDIDRIVARALLIAPALSSVAPAPTGLVAQHRNVTITPDAGINVRIDPSTKGANIVSKLVKGTVVAVDGYVVGEEIEGNNLWWKTKGENHYMWSGATSAKPNLEVQPESVEKLPPLETPTTTPVDDGVLKSREELEDELLLKTDDMRQLIKDINDKQKIIDTYFSENEQLRKTIYGNEETVKDIQTYKSTNEELSKQLTEQQIAYTQKIGELKKQADDAAVTVFKGWELFEIPAGSNALTRVPALVIKLIGLVRDIMVNGYVIGWKKGGQLVRVDDIPTQPTPLQPVSELLQ